MRVEDLFIYFPGSLEKALSKLSSPEREALQEVRLKAGGPVSLTLSGKTVYLTPGGAAQTPEQAIQLTPFDLEQIFRRFCQNSVHTYQADIASGFVTIRNGHRVGICGTCVLDPRGTITGIRSVSSLCVRLARQVKGSGDGALRAILKNGELVGTMIVSPPGCGKTTMLRDVARQLSLQNIRVCVIDERSELAACSQGIPQNELGPCCDELDGFAKSAGMMYAVRNLNPQVLVCDEIGSHEDIDAILHAMNAGIPVVATAHASAPDELLQRPRMEELLASGAVGKVIFLRRGERPGQIQGIYDARLLLDRGTG